MFPRPQGRGLVLPLRNGLHSLDPMNWARSTCQKERRVFSGPMRNMNPWTIPSGWKNDVKSFLMGRTDSPGVGIVREFGGLLPKTRRRTLRPRGGGSSADRSPILQLLEAQPELQSHRVLGGSCWARCHRRARSWKSPPPRGSRVPAPVDPQLRPAWTITVR